MVSTGFRAGQDIGGITSGLSGCPPPSVGGNRSGKTLRRVRWQAARLLCYQGRAQRVESFPFYSKFLFRIIPGRERIHAGDTNFWPVAPPNMVNGVPEQLPSGCRDRIMSLARRAIGDSLSPNRA